jgi:diaminopimelate epimerase
MHRYRRHGAPAIVGLPACSRTELEAMTTSTTDSPRRRGPQLDEIRFWKMHGTGNDFVILDLTTTPEPSPELCSFLADRNIGVGCDLVLGVGSSRTSSAAAAFSIWTSTGVRSSQCGNGARCVARWLWEQGWVTSEWFQIESPSSTHNAALLPDGSVSIELGEPSLDSPRSIQVDDATEGFDLVPVWLGNPHAVIDLAAIGTVPLASVGRAVQASDTFDPQTNVGAATLLDRSHISLRVYEYGAGETLACGSGACAAVASLRRRGLVDDEVVVSQRGGDVRVRWQDNGDQVVMTGPAVSVFEGVIRPGELPPCN